MSEVPLYVYLEKDWSAWHWILGYLIPEGPKVDTWSKVDVTCVKSLRLLLCGACPQSFGVSLTLPQRWGVCLADAPHTIAYLNCFISACSRVER